MTYVSVNSAEQCVARVADRALEERRTIPAHIVLRRYPRSLTNLAGLAPLLDRIDVYDNTGRTFAQVARLERSRIVSLGEQIPPWAESSLREPLEVFRDRAIGRGAEKARRPELRTAGTADK